MAVDAYAGSIRSGGSPGVIKYEAGHRTDIGRTLEAEAAEGTERVGVVLKYWGSAGLRYCAVARYPVRHAPEGPLVDIDHTWCTDATDPAVRARIRGIVMGARFAKNGEPLTGCGRGK
jgi:hypothetical protein